MHSKQHFPNVIFGEGLRPQGAALAIMLLLLFLTFVLLFMTLAAQPAQAQTFTVMHNFTGALDGGSPQDGLTIDAAGNFYGTTQYGGAGFGTVFKLSHKGSGWVFTPLYVFRGGSDGANPGARVIIGPDGSLYGTTAFGGESSCYSGCGTVFNLKPAASVSPNILGAWTETVLYRFKGGSDGERPESELVFDQAGNLYGTTELGGEGGVYGTVFKLAPSAGGWTESILHQFDAFNDGYFPWAGLIFDKAGNLYGTTPGGGAYSSGVVYQLTPSESGWTLNVLYSFQGGNDGDMPFGGLIFDNAGNLYGTTASGGALNGGTAFELTPSSGTGTWTFTLLYDFRGSGDSGPLKTLTMDAAGNLYGTMFQRGAYGWGAVFKLAPGNGSWTYTSLHDFTGGSDGGYPSSNVILDANGNFYGTTEYLGSGNCYSGCGEVWEITP